MKINRFLLIPVLAFSIVQNSDAQYLISGYIHTGEKNKTVYLSLLKYQEETLIDENQILFSTKTDTAGYFEFKGQLLSEKDKLYRIHANLDNAAGLQLISSNDKKNFHNFIFSNSDTLRFPKTENFWFIPAENTNKTDPEWRKLKRFEESLDRGRSAVKNKEVQQQTLQDFSNKVKHFSRDSLQSPLVRLLSFSDINRRNFDLKTDFEKDPAFYNNILDELNKYYAGTSYYLQYQEELFKISSSIILQKYQFHKNLNAILGMLTLALLACTVFLFSKLRGLNKTKSSNPGPALTNQEEKIAGLIIENKSNKEIAGELYISLSTVKTHTRNLYAKLEVTNRKELAEKFKNQPGD